MPVSPRYILHSILYCLFFMPPLHALPRLLIEAHGRVGTAARQFTNDYERGITMKLARALQEKLCDAFDTDVSLLTPHEGAEERIARINKTMPNLFITLCAYKSTRMKPTICLYTYGYDQLAENSWARRPACGLIPLEYAHCLNQVQTGNIRHTLLSSLSQQNVASFCAVNKAITLPFRPLFGIISPALAIEIGIWEDTQWEELVGPITCALREVKMRFFT
jgi:hypothetical protein